MKDVDKLLEQFKNREVKAKDIFEIRRVSKEDAIKIVADYHYLGTKKFMFTVGYGLYFKNDNILDGYDEMLGCATFGVVGGIVALKGWFSVDNSHSTEFFELTRLVMLPKMNGCNATSFLLGNAIKDIKKNFKDIRAIVTLADNSMHCGAIYQACNFKYFGLANKKTDFVPLGGNNLNPRGKTKDTHGVWIPRTQKHRYCYIIDKTLKINYEEQPFPKGNDMNEAPNCCDGLHVVYDKRFNEYFTCPRCEKEFRLLTPREALEIMKKHDGGEGGC